MDRVQEMRVFLAVAEQQGFAGAARQLGISAAAATRAVAALEARIGARLLVRTTRSVRLSDAGTQFLEDCRRILADLDSADELASGARMRPRGLLTLASPVLFGQCVLNPVILDYLDENPRVTVRALFADRTPNLHEEAIDVAVAMGTPSDSALIAVPIGSIRRVVCATPGYLADCGTPTHPDQFAAHRIVLSSADAPTSEWRFRADEATLAVHLQSRLTVSTNEAAIHAVRSGWGLTRVMSYQIAAELSSGALVSVLDDYAQDALPVHLVYRDSRKSSLRVRSFVDYAVARLRSEPALGNAAA